MPWRDDLASRALRSGDGCKRCDNTFDIGDAAQLPQAVGRQACNASDMGALAAASAERLLVGRTLKPLMPTPKPLPIAFGDLRPIWSRAAACSPARCWRARGLKGRDFPGRR
ncbi:MAG TPA: hypothetical protein DCY47_12175 [Candidatus Accumulibacter sp.]|nr:hypothetical protein [Accumulibacter sp.]